KQSIFRPAASDAVETCPSIVLGTFWETVRVAWSSLRSAPDLLEEGLPRDREGIQPIQFLPLASFSFLSQQPLNVFLRKYASFPNVCRRPFHHLYEFRIRFDFFQRGFHGCV